MFNPSCPSYNPQALMCWCLDRCEFHFGGEFPLWQQGGGSVPTPRLSLGTVDSWGVTWAFSAMCANAYCHHKLCHMYTYMRILHNARKYLLSSPKICHIHPPPSHICNSANWRRIFWKVPSGAVAKKHTKKAEINIEWGTVVLPSGTSKF